MDMTSLVETIRGLLLNLNDDELRFIAGEITNRLSGESLSTARNYWDRQRKRKRASLKQDGTQNGNSNKKEKSTLFRSLDECKFIFNEDQVLTRGFL
jgi:hypothetical protein